MNIDDLKCFEKEIMDLEKERINSSNWADLTLSEIELIEDLEKRKEYKKQINEFHMRIVNTFSGLVPKSFQFSIPNDRLTYRIMATEYMNYFYSKGMTREEIIKMLSLSRTTTEEEEKQK